MDNLIDDLIEILSLTFSVIVTIFFVMLANYKLRLVLRLKTGLHKLKIKLYRRRQK